MLTTHASIFSRLKTDDPASREHAWCEFRRDYAPVIAGFARKLGVKAHDLDDVIQDVMLGFFSQAPSFAYDRSAGRFRGYLKVCTFRAMQRRLGAQVRIRQVSLDQIDPDQVQVQQAWDDVWEQQRLQRALDATRRQYNQSKTFQAFELHVIKGLSVQEVAVSLDINPSTVQRAKASVGASLKLRLQGLKDSEG
jgi:RNA polymerase sigma factor (sigma-70 family)